jgi:catechol 2,3-dioxygenase-like lactoylglutathione lyase family enzyme
MKPRLTHLALGVRNLEHTIAFYRKHAGLHVVHDRQDGSVRVVWLGEHESENQFVLVLFESGTPSSPAPSTLQHLGFAVDSRAEVDAAAATARSEGVLLQEPTYAGPVVGYFCIVRDPDGNQVEFSHGQPITTAALAAALGRPSIAN